MRKKHSRNWTRWALNSLLVFGFLISLPGFASGGPLFVKNNSPAYLWVMSPSFEQFDFYNGSKWNALVLSQYSSMYAVSDFDQPGLENPVALDMETFSVFGRVERRLNAFSSFYVEVPLIYHWKGMFDSFIENYHDIIGVDNGGRQLRPDNQFAFQFGDLNLDGPEAGVGDIKLGINIFKIRDISRFRFAFSVFAKLPTGNPKKGLGSGSFDVGAQVAFSNIFDHFQLDYGFGFMNLGTPDSRLNTTLGSMGFGYIAVSTEIYRDIQGVAQLYLSSSPYDTGYNRLDDYQAMLTIGAIWHDWQFSFSEDVFTYTAADITVSVARKFRF